jgi:hypothetical protein
LERNFWRWGRDRKNIKLIISYDGKKIGDRKTAEIIYNRGQRLEIDHRINLTDKTEDHWEFKILK